jgi:polyferredoxin
MKKQKIIKDSRWDLLRKILVWIIVFLIVLMMILVVIINPKFYTFVDFKEKNEYEI